MFQGSSPKKGPELIDDSVEDSHYSRIRNDVSNEDNTVIGNSFHAGPGVKL
jgi:hypothetical protein